MTFTNGAVANPYRKTFVTLVAGQQDLHFVVELTDMCFCSKVSV